jgi:hypothetical protein
MASKAIISVASKKKDVTAAIVNQGLDILKPCTRAPKTT